ncbi:MAG: hypothetical protein KAQ89_05055 [Planctomycetes bacterium]|nr:hypothetical protein [Planctomycetota bacterium]
MNKVTTKIFTIVILIFYSGLILLQGGCAARAYKMVPLDLEVANKHPYSVRVNDPVGGRETSIFWSSQISNSAFAEAITESLVKSGVFKTVIKGEGADYILDVTILHCDQPVPMISLDVDVKMETQWMLTDAKTFRPVWTDTFETTYREKLTDTFLPQERIQRANEGSAKTNIAEGIRRLSMLKL